MHLCILLSLVRNFTGGREDALLNRCDLFVCYHVGVLGRREASEKLLDVGFGFRLPLIEIKLLGFLWLVRDERGLWLHLLTSTDKRGLSISHHRQLPGVFLHPVADQRGLPNAAHKNSPLR